MLSVVGERYAEGCESFRGKGLTGRLFVRYVRQKEGEGEWVSESPVLNLLREKKIFNSLALSRFPSVYILFP